MTRNHVMMTPATTPKQASQNLKPKLVENSNFLTIRYKRKHEYGYIIGPLYRTVKIIHNIQKRPENDQDVKITQDKIIMNARPKVVRNNKLEVKKCQLFDRILEV